LLRPFDPKRHMPLTNLETVRDTLVGIHADLKRVRDLELACELIETALVEIAVVEQRRLATPYLTLDAHVHLRRKA
jgi:hypothetical protein